jgi:hypothetical protein
MKLVLHELYNTPSLLNTKEDEEDLLDRVEDTIVTNVLDISKQVEERLRIAATGGFEHS